MYEMELKPGSKHGMLAMTGVITATTEKNSLITLLQDMEYIHGQLFERLADQAAGLVRSPSILSFLMSHNFCSNMSSWCSNRSTIFSLSKSLQNTTRR